MQATRITHIPNGLAVSIMETIAAQVREDENGCWIWQGQLDRSGYGKTRFRLGGSRRCTGAHRAAWLAMRGDIPADLNIDHLCKVTSCVNPYHMEPVTNSVNVKRGDHSAKKGRSGRRPGKPMDACARHGRQDGYMFTRRDGYVTYVCRICRKARVNAFRLRRASMPTG